MITVSIGFLILCSISLIAYVALSTLGLKTRQVVPSAAQKKSSALDEWETVGYLLRDRRLSRTRFVDKQLRRWSLPKRVQLAIAQAGMSIMTDTWLAFCAGSALATIAAAFLVGLPAYISVLLGFGGFFLPDLFLSFKKRQRRSQIESQLPDALDSIARAMQAGNSFSGALVAVGRDTLEPLGGELRLVSEEINFGSSTRDGLLAMADRLDSMDVRYFVIAVLIHAQTGGNLTDLLKSLSALIRDRQRLRKLGRALSAEGRLSAWILILMPFVTAGLIHFVNPEFMGLLWTHPAGLVAVQVMLLLMLVGAGWMWRIVHFKV